MTNCYKILGVKDFASAEEIKTAYRKLSKKFHPDVNEGDRFFEERFREVQDAYEILCDSRRKELHDSKLKNNFTSSTNFEFKEKSYSEASADKTTEESKDPGGKDRPIDPKDEVDQATKDANSVLKTLAVMVIIVVVIGIVASLLLSKQSGDNTKMTCLKDRFFAKC